MSRIILGQGTTLNVVSSSVADLGDQFTTTDARQSISVGAEGTPAGDGALTYNSSTGELSYTPPVLSGFTGDSDDITEGTTNLYHTDARVQTVIDTNTAGFTTDAGAVSAVESEATLDLTGQLTVTNSSIPVVIQRNTNSGGGSGSLTVQRRANSNRRNNIYATIVDRNDSDREYILYGFGGERTAAEERKWTLRLFEDTTGTPTSVIPITVESVYNGSSFDTPAVTFDADVTANQPIQINTDTGETKCLTATHTLDTADGFHQFIRSKMDFTSQTPYKATASYLFEAESDADGVLNIGNFGFTYQPTGKHQVDYALARTFATDEFTENALTLSIEQSKIQTPVTFVPVQFVTTAPSSPNAGDWYVDTDDESFYIYAGSTDGWQSVTPDTGTVVFDSTNTALKIFNGSAWVAV